MPDLDISRLPLAAAVADGDLFIKWDSTQVSGQRTQKFTAAQFRAYIVNIIPVGPAGPPGAAGVPGPQGPPGKDGGGAGTVTSVALAAPSDFTVSGSPITASGTFTVTRNAQAANIVMAGPASGANAVPTYRALVASDIPALPYTTTAQAAAAAPVQSVAGRTGSVTLAVADVSGAASLASPAFTGTPTVPTAAAGTNTTQAASTAFVLANAGSGSSASTYPPTGRLTLTAGTPVLTSSVTGANAIFYTPYTGASAPLWNGTAFVSTSFAELSQALTDTAKSPAAAVANTLYDLFVWNDAGTIRCTRGPAWSAGATAGSNNARGTGAGSTALTRVQGVLVNAVAVVNGPAAGYGTYVGTVVTDAGGATVSMNFGGAAAGGSPARLGVWNAYNRKAVPATVYDTTTSHTYASATVRAYNGSTGNAIVSVQGLVEDAVDLMFRTYENDSQNVTGQATAAARVGIAVNSTSANAASQAATSDFAGAGIVVGLKALPSLGLSTYQATEASPSAVTVTFYDVGNAVLMGTFLQ